MEVTLEQMLTQLNDTMTHVRYVNEAGHKLITELLILGETEKAIDLQERILRHDHSKSLRDEFLGLAAFSDDVSALKDANVKTVGGDKFPIIKLHWKRNDHHPEFWSDKMPDSLVDETPLVISPDMPEIAIAEMCCDWFARSAQYGTDVFEFYKKRTEFRWRFSDEQLEMIEKFLTLLKK